MSDPHVLHLLDDPDPIMSVVLVGHLNIEALLTVILEARLADPCAILDRNLMFARKVAFARAIGAISEDQRRVLVAVNRIRNKYAHRLGYHLSFDDAFALVRTAEQCGIDFSDDTIHCDRAKSEEFYGVYGIVHEVFANVFMDLAVAYIDEIPEVSEMVG